MPELFAGFGIYKLERHRLVLPGADAHASWLGGKESLDCLGLPGPTGGLVIFSPHALQEHRAIVAQLRQEDDLMPDQMGSALYELTRYTMVAWEITIGPDRRFTLPAGARDLGIVPAGPNDSVGLVVSQGRIEVWRVPELLAQIQSSAVHRAELEVQAGLPRE